MGDINREVKEEWKESTTSRDRIKEVLEETTEYTGASAIAQRALVSLPTARKYLKQLVNVGVGESIEEGQKTLYKRAESRLIYQRIEQLRTEHSRDELIDSIEEMKSEMQSFRDKHGVEEPTDLAIQLEPETDEWGDVGEWRSAQRNLALTQAALQVDQAHRVMDA